MAFFAQEFSEQSIQTLANRISAYLAANPTFTAINITNTVEGANFYALLLYSV